VRLVLAAALAPILVAGALATTAFAHTTDTAPPPNPVVATSDSTATVGEYQTTLAGDPATVYHPADAADRRHPVALLLQGANVSRANYARYARATASYGFIVVVPDHSRLVFGVPMLFAEEKQVTDAAAWMTVEDTRAGSPVAGHVDTANLVLLGHSAGGAAGLYAVEGTCMPPFCLVPPYTRPAQLRAAALFGTNSAVPGVPGADPIETAGVPVALLQGSLDTRATPTAAQATYDALTGGPKTLITVLGANHYGITDTANPVGAQPDPSVPTLDRQQSIATIARWSAMWLRAQLGDVAARFYVRFVGPHVDANVLVQRAD